MNENNITLRQKLFVKLHGIIRLRVTRRVVTAVAMTYVVYYLIHAGQEDVNVVGPGKSVIQACFDNTLNIEVMKGITICFRIL